MGRCSNVGVVMGGQIAGSGCDFMSYGVPLFYAYVQDATGATW